MTAERDVGDSSDEDGPVGEGTVVTHRPPQHTTGGGRRSRQDRKKRRWSCSPQYSAYGCDQGQKETTKIPLKQLSMGDVAAPRVMMMCGLRAPPATARSSGASV